MVKFRFEFSDETFNCPESFQELTFGAYVELKKCEKDDPAAIISAATGAPYEWVFNTKNRDIDKLLIPKLEFLENVPDPEKYKMPKTIKIDGVEINVPTNLESYTYGQKIAMERVIDRELKSSKDLDLCMANVVSIYIAPLATGKKFTSELADQFINKINQMPFHLIYPIGCFFLTNLTGLKKGKKRHWLKNRTRIWNWRVLKNWINLGRQSQLTVYPVGMSQNGI